MAKKSYTEDDIETMEWVKHLRERPGMYVGSLGDGSGYHDCVYIMIKEIVDNGVDEFIRGHGKRIDVTVGYDSGEVTVRDYGDGIPLGKVVDADLEYVAVFDKEKEFTCVYEEPLYGHAYVKRFSFGGMIQNKEYRLAPAKSKVLLFKEGCPERIYVKFRPAKNQRVHQSHFDPKETAVRGASAKGVQMTTKAIAKVAVLKPSWWNDAEGDVKGGLF